MSDQLGLFGPPEHPRKEELETLARALPSSLRMGTSSWTFPGWKGLVYHRKYSSQKAFVQGSLGEYAAHPLFRTVCIDRGFYQPLGDTTLAGYGAQLPADFQCALKVWRRIATRVFGRHDATPGRPNPDFLNPELFAAELAAPLLRSFSEHLGVLIVEIPPAPGGVNQSGFLRRIKRFLEAQPAALRFAFELRDERLLTPQYAEVLDEAGASHVFNYWTAMPSLGEQFARLRGIPGPELVCRLMIPPHQGYAQLRQRFEPFDRLVAPQAGMRRDVLLLLEAAGHRPCTIIANNKAEGCSPLTIEGIAEAIRARKEK